MEVGVLEGRNRFSQLVEAAERGETTVVLKRGRPVAKLVPIDDLEAKRLQRKRALAMAEAFGERVAARMGRPMTHEEVMDGKDEGRR